MRAFLAVGLDRHCRAMRKSLSLLPTLIVCVVAGLTIGPAGAAHADGVTIKLETRSMRRGRRRRSRSVSRRSARSPRGSSRQSWSCVDEAKRPVPSQLVDADGDEAPDELVFQVDLRRAREASALTRPGRRAPACPPATTFQRLRPVRARAPRRLRLGERSHRPPRCTAPGSRPRRTTRSPRAASTSGSSAVPRLLVNEWYMTDDYHRDHGDGADIYAGGQVARLRRASGSRTATSSPSRATSRARACSRTARSASCSSSPTRRWKAGWTPMLSESEAHHPRRRLELRFAIESLLPRRDERSPAPATAVAVGIAKHEGRQPCEVDKNAGAGCATWEPLKPEGR